jgi:putative DNA primase/helicase
MIPTHELQAIRSRANILAIIGQRVTLRKEGHEYIGCCPFHEEKTPSFKVDPNKNGGVFICFGCGAKGDVFHFVQRIDGLSFSAAITQVKELSGTDTPKAAAIPGQRRILQPAGPQVVLSKLGPIVAVYRYVDEKQLVIYEVCRHEPGAPILDKDGKWTGENKAKDFRQRVPTRTGYSYSVKGVRRVLYRLPEVLAAAEVWICEGEKDVHTLEAQGVTATTNSGGADAKWLPEFSEALKGKDVLIVPDNDGPGQARGERIANELAGKADRVTVLKLPDGYKDVTRFIEAGNSLHDLRVLADEARASVPAVTQKPFAPLEAGEKLSPNDIARMILRDHHIMSTEEGFVFEYNHRIWEQTSAKRIAAYAMAYDTHNETKAARRNEAANYVVTYTHTTNIRWRQIATHEIPVWNGVFDLETGKLRPHRKEDFLEAVPVTSYHPGRECPTWLAALKLYWGQDPDYGSKVAALQEFFGYCLMTHARYKKALMIIGESDTGKSQILNVIRMLVGYENICCVALEVMDDATRLTPLIGKMVNLLAEVTSRAQLADGGFKTLVSGEDPISINPKHLKEITYVPTAKHVIACNSLPRVTDHSRGIFNRLLLIKFNRVIRPEERDRDVADKLRAEREGILAWALDGARRLNDNGGEFTFIPESEHEIADYRDQENPVNAFVEEKCWRANEDEVDPILLSEFTDNFGKWAGKTYDVRAVGSMVRNAGLKVERVQKDDNRFKRKRCVFGLQWREA